MNPDKTVVLTSTPLPQGVDTNNRFAAIESLLQRTLTEEERKELMQLQESLIIYGRRGYSFSSAFHNLMIADFELFRLHESKPKGLLSKPKKNKPKGPQHPKNHWNK